MAADGCPGTISRSGPSRSPAAIDVTHPTMALGSPMPDSSRKVAGPSQGSHVVWSGHTYQKVPTTRNPFSQSDAANAS